MLDSTSQADSTTAGRLPLNKHLEQEFEACRLVRPFRRACYDPGDRLEYDVTGVVPANTARLVAEVEHFAGSGFAGQVYRVRLLKIRAGNGPIAGLTEGRSYAIKVLKPASRLASAFRDFLYFAAFQGHFSAQVNPAAVRTGVLWQKLIRRAVAITFGDEHSVCDTYGTFYDRELRSFGEINEWVDGRIWKFEVDNQMFHRWSFRGDPPPDHNCPEYVHKKLFMQRLVALLHEMGAPELARQYEWWTCKSQPNALKRLGTEGSPADGVTAIDFRAGLALLPFLPMSPIDPWLILRGLFRGRLAQFDGSNPARLRQFIAAHRKEFDDLRPALKELREQESIYRGSLPDLTHHHVRLILDARLRGSVKKGIITGWKNLGRLDDEHARRLAGSRLLFPLLLLISLVPLLGRRIVKLWGETVTREHVKRIFSSFSYLLRAMRGARIEKLVVWHRRGRASEERALKLVDRPVRYWVQLVLLGWMPSAWHRFLVEPDFAWRSVRDKFQFTVKFLRVAPFREEWLLEQVRQGREEGMITQDEADKISRQVKDPFIQRYLRCLAVHLCTLPVTQVCMALVWLLVSGYLLLMRDWSCKDAVLAGTGAAVAIQGSPISPGSMARGLFVLLMMIKDRDIRNYYIAAPISFLHVIGYLAFPFQMVVHDPALARFLAGRWVRSMVHFVPVFGERGGLLEHAVFDLSFNLPLSVRRGFKTNPVRWVLGTVLATGVLAGAVFWSLSLFWH